MCVCVGPWRTVVRWVVRYNLHNVEDLRGRLTCGRVFGCGCLLRVIEVVVIKAVACGL